MKKLVTVFGVAAVATLAGCKDPNYKPMSFSQDEVKVVEPTPAPVVAPEVVKTPPPAPIVVETRPVVVAEPETTVYIVQNGDYLAKISKKYNVTINSIKKLNNLKSDTVRVGQKLKLPGKIDVGVQSAPVTKTASAKAFSEYKGATKEYVVKSGDTLGAIAYGNGCNIRQLKKLNNLTSDSLKAGQKLKIPAEVKTVVAEKKVVDQKKTVDEKKALVKETEPQKAVETPVEPVAPAVPVEPVTPAVSDEVAEPTTTYIVQEGDDMTGVTIRFGVTAAAIRELNGLAEDAQLTPGQTIKLPADVQQ